MASTDPIRLAEYIRSIPDFPKPGILFRDITPLLASPVAFREAVRQLAVAFRGQEVDVVAAAEARGFIFAAPLAFLLSAGFVPVRKLGKLPAPTIQVEYELEYGSNILEVHVDAITKGSRILVVDDLLATGGTVAATVDLIEGLGGQVVACAFLVELGFLSGRDRLDGHRVISLIKY
jgi:adenine phosphoribosyltransferase